MSVISGRVEPCENVIFRDLEGESVLLDLRTGMYFGLNPVGTRIWHLLQDGKSAIEITDILLNEFDVSPEQCRADVLGLLAQLQSKGLVQLTP